MGEIISEGRLAQRESVMRLRPNSRALPLGDFMYNFKRKNYMDTLRFYLQNNHFYFKHNVISVSLPRA